MSLPSRRSLTQRRDSVRRVASRLRWTIFRLSTADVSSGASCRLGPRGDIHITRHGGLALGSRVTLAADFHCFSEGKVEIGSDTFINRWFYVSSLSKVTIGSGVRFGERCSIHDENHSTGAIAYDSRPVVIEDDVWLGANVTVLPGVRIGRGAIIGAGAVVREDVPPHSLAAGVPARVVKSLRPA